MDKKKQEAADEKGGQEAGPRVKTRKHREGKMKRKIPEAKMKNPEQETESLERGGKIPKQGMESPKQAYKSQERGGISVGQGMRSPKQAHKSQERGRISPEQCMKSPEPKRPRKPNNPQRAPFG